MKKHLKILSALALSSAAIVATPIIMTSCSSPSQSGTEEGEKDQGGKDQGWAQDSTETKAIVSNSKFTPTNDQLVFSSLITNSDLDPQTWTLEQLENYVFPGGKWETKTEGETTTVVSTEYNSGELLQKFLKPAKAQITWSTGTVSLDTSADVDYSAVNSNKISGNVSISESSSSDTKIFVIMVSFSVKEGYTWNANYSTLAFSFISSMIMSS